MEDFNAGNRNIVGRSLLRAFGHPVVTCCGMLAVVFSKFENGQIFHATFVDVVWGCIRLARLVQEFCTRACTLVRFSTHHPTHHNMMSKRVQHAVLTMLRYPALKSFDRLAGACKCWINNVAIFRVEMLGSQFCYTSLFSCNFASFY